MNPKERSISPLTGVVQPATKNVQTEKVQVTVNLVPGGYPMLVFFIFLVLKLTDHITWSWLWVTSPLWLVVVFSFFTATVLVLKKSKQDD
jgi:hypothetical protein